MKEFTTIIFLLVTTLSYGQNKKPDWLLSFGIDYRQSPIDIEDASSGPLMPIARSTFGELTDYSFWKVLSIHGRLGIKTKDNWLIYIVGNTRYNHNYYLEDPCRPTGPTTTIAYCNENTKDKEKIKFDLFFDIEKKLRLKKRQEKYLTVLAGLGFTNINSHTDVTYQSNFNSDTIRYFGSYLHFGPKFSLGYQYKRVKGSLDAYLVEDHIQSNLTALWIGATISYEMILKKKKKANSLLSQIYTTQIFKMSV
jgi:hypothetical protein